jgi:opacity protein-like surface antigen
MDYKISKMKKTLYLHFTFLFMSFIGYAQSAKRISMGISFEGATCYRQLNYGYLNKIVSEIRNNEETARLGFTTGVNFRYRLNKKIVFVSGVLYSNAGFKNNNKILEWATNASDLPTKSKTVFAFKILSLPLKLNYKINIGKLNTYVTTGMSLNYLINRKTIITNTFSDGSSSKSFDTQKLGFQNFSFSAMVGFGIDYPLSKRMTINVEPLYTRSFTSIIADNNAKEYLYSAGINASVFYNFKIKK